MNLHLIEDACDDEHYDENKRYKAEKKKLQILKQRKSITALKELEIQDRRRLWNPNKSAAFQQ
ncbi:CLUMA_CG000631, isoform A [Clunio marinus]|uniref:CLUMA_CG000631, isoform A n=1 Tax=Clunio marinus TaxID=568069 RepID=A0A1J1HFM7_9DIPT|nr:CLUMA_CG000631, isoform A [Clunio marinus]